MRKKILALVMVGIMAVATMAGCGGSSSSSSSSSDAVLQATNESADFGDLTAEYDPTAGYDVYTLVDYTIEDIDAQFVATVSAKADGTEYEVHCLFYGDEQIAVVDGDGNVTSDKTGFMSTDAPIIVENAKAQNNWAPIN